MAESGFVLLIMGVVVLLISIANIVFNKERKQWGTSAKFLFYLPIVISSMLIITGLTNIFAS